MSTKSSAGRRSLVLLLATLAFSFCVSSTLRADTVKFPKDNPALSVDLPAGWRVDFISADMMPGGDRVQFQLEAGSADLSIKVLPADAGITDAASAKANISKVALIDMKDLDASKCGDVEEKSIAGHKGFGTMVTTGIGPMFYAIFTPDGKRYFSMFSMTGGADPIIAAIKAAE